MKKKKISKIYYLLSLMPSGLPKSLLTLIFPDYEEFMKEENITKSLIYTDPNDDWKYIKEYKKNIISCIGPEEKNECIENCLKVYAKLLFYYIEKNRQKICFPDSNIHYIFNSYNGTGIWKTFDIHIYNYCFYYEIYNNKYDNIFKNEFILEKHENNITNLILNNLDELQKLIKDDIIKEYLEQIILMLPSCYFFEKECKIIIKKYIYICEKLNLVYSKKRLLLFLCSIDKNKQIDINEFSRNQNELEINEFSGNQIELEINAYFLNALKKKEKNFFEELIKKYKDTKYTSNGETNTDEVIKKIMIYSYYEIAIASLIEKKNDDAINNLNEAKKISKEINNYFLMDRMNINIVLVNLLKKKESLKENQNEKIISNSYNLLNEVIHQKQYDQNIQLPLINEAYDLKLELNKEFENDIVILNSNPLKNGLSLLGNGICCNLNNQYYLLEKLQEKIKMRLKIESKLLNEDNLYKYLNQNGQILIIQSDDFTDKGEIVLETEYGNSQILSIENLKFLPEKIKYTVVILCFFKSGKLKEIFENKVKYLITFDDMTYDNLSFGSLSRYNELSIEFLINFIVKTTEVKNKKIEDIFEESKNLFINGLKKNKKFKNISNFISLTNKNNLNKYINYKNYHNYRKIDLNQPLIEIPPNVLLFQNYYYAYEIYKIIKIILSEKHQFINVYLSNDDRIKIYNSRNINKKSIISIEIMKFLYRHQSFEKLYYIYKPEKYGKSLKEIIDNILEKGNSTKVINDENKNNNDNLTKFILINNYTKFKNKDKKLNEEKKVIFEEPIKLKDKVKYLIMTKKEIIIDKENKIKSNDKKYKNEIIMKNIDFDIYKIKLESQCKGIEKHIKDKINTDESISSTNEDEINIDENTMNINKDNTIENNKDLEENNNSLSNYKNIYDYPLDSYGDEFSYKSESEDDIST